MINKDLCDHHTYPEEAVKGDYETRWILEHLDLFIDHRLNRRNLPGPREKFRLLFCFGYCVLYDLAILVSRKSIVF
ncbi:hypothetical protein XELAEV_18027630mg [Xenopus laevis]|uniref:Uncharacterized protein n=1 Tax=Xenopus laevis TaxID=8355 RepID=A0A974CWQ6_XENLA|nr:hypothetical protein XELAEV_18027630mg [Xenopus laevis]